MEVDSSFDNLADANNSKQSNNLAQPNVAPVPNPYLPQRVQKPFKIEARDIILRNFLMKEQLEQQALTLTKAKNTDYVNAYLSTPQFINTLTDLSDEVMLQPTPEDKKRFLKQQLCTINKKLPAQVYIPFVSSSMRNHAILNIVVEEAKIFQTKERAPLLLCIEVFRPIEMTLDEPTELYSH